MIKVSKAMVVAGLTLASAGFASQVGIAQESATLGQGNIVVRLCPETCVAVNGHGLKPGGKVTVFETKSNWVRVSDYLNRRQLVRSFGSSITRRPALWVAASQLAGAQPAAAAPAPKPAEQNTAASQNNTALPSRIAIPTFRPGTVFKNATEQASAGTEQSQDDQVAETQQEEAPAEKPAEVVEAAPVDTTAPDGVRRQLTWEELQKKLAEQAEEHRRRSQLSEAEKAARAQEEAEKLKAEQAARIARQREADEAAKVAKAAEAARAAEAAKAEEARKAAEAAEAAKAAEAAAAAAKVEEERKAAEAKQQAAAEAAAKAAANAAAEANKPAETQTEVASTATSNEPVFDPDISNPIAFGARPKTLTKALLDKRLSKLPGSKSKVKKDVVIALRHYALGLLNSGECSGIDRGGPSAVPGMLFISCTDDPTYLRQFPIKEESW